jgi:hypothetical protein
MHWRWIIRKNYWKFSLAQTGPLTDKDKLAADTRRHTQTQTHPSTICLADPSEQIMQSLREKVRKKCGTSISK